TDSNARFCLTHHCIGDFGSGNGSVVRCSDGSYSHSGGVQGACSWHGGVASSGYSASSNSAGSGSPPPPPPPPQPTPQPTPQQRAAAARARARRIAAERAAAARRARLARIAAARRARDRLLTITDELVAANDRIYKAHGQGANADYSELDRIEQRLTDWSVDH